MNTNIKDDFKKLKTSKEKNNQKRTVSLKFISYSVFILVWFFICVFLLEFFDALTYVGADPRVQAEGIAIIYLLTGAILGMGRFIDPIKRDKSVKKAKLKFNGLKALVLLPIPGIYTLLIVAAFSGLIPMIIPSFILESEFSKFGLVITGYLVLLCFDPKKEMSEHPIKVEDDGHDKEPELDELEKGHNDEADV